MHDYNNRKTRLIISLMLGMPSYPIFALIRNFPFSQITDYALVQYGITASAAFFLVFEIQQLKSVFLDKVLPWESHTWKRLVSELTSSFLVTTLVVCAAYAFLYVVVWDMQLFWPSIYLYISLVFFISLSFMAFVNISPLITKWKASIIKAEQLERQTAEAKLEALRVQLSPHFFFNNLSILNGLVGQNPSKARGFIEKLSEVFRYILAHKNEEVVTLNEEIAFIENYFFLLQSRFEEKLSYSIQIDEEAEHLIPPVTLQQLVENAVKHNEASYKKPLKIDILEKDGYLIVENNLQRIKPKVDSSGIGIENIKQRFNLLSDKEVGIVEENEKFIVKLPLLSKNRTPQGQ